MEKLVPILSEVRGWFERSGLEDMGRKYWKKRSYILQGFVKDDPTTKKKHRESQLEDPVIGPKYSK